MSGLDIPALLVFAGALAVAAAVPGPGVAALVARVLGRGRNGAIAFAVGLALGDLIWLTCAVFGVTVIAETFHEVFVAIKFAGAAYLVYMAWKLWAAPAVPPVAGEMPREGGWRLFLAGLAVCLGNPKVMVFYVALLPGLIDVVHIDLLAYAELSAVVAAILTVVFGGYVVLALRARRFFSTPRAMRLVNRGSGVVLAGTAVAIATR